MVSLYGTEVVSHGFLGGWKSVNLVRFHITLPQTQLFIQEKKAMTFKINPMKIATYLKKSNQI